MTDPLNPHGISLASVALEPNRWKGGDRRFPSLNVSEWSERAAQAGFSGWELWEPHFFLASAEERRALATSPLPVAIFNSYAIPGIDELDTWKRVVEAVSSLGDQVRGVKFNLGKDDTTIQHQVETAIQWAELLPPMVTMLCECHPGTVIELPDAASRAFSHWPSTRFQAILHPLGNAPKHCQIWFEALRGRIRHLHWQARDPDNRMTFIDVDPSHLSAAITSCRRFGFSGSQSIEFVDGTGSPGESVAGLFKSACEGLRTLRRYWDSSAS